MKFINNKKYIKKYVANIVSFVKINSALTFFQDTKKRKEKAKYKRRWCKFLDCSDGTKQERNTS